MSDVTPINPAPVPTRDDYVQACPVFGLDSQGKPGMDETCDECLSCKERGHEPPAGMFAACLAECAKATRQYGEENPAGVPSGGDTGEGQAAAPATGDEDSAADSEKESTMTATATKEKPAKKAKAPKAPKEPRVTVISVGIDLLRQGGTYTQESFLEAIKKTAGTDGDPKSMTRAKLIYRIGAALGHVKAPK